MPPPRVSLIVVNYNAAAMTGALIRSVSAGPGGSGGAGADEVIVVDNASPEGPPCCPPGVVLVRAGTNLGYGAGANLGARQASGDVLVISNPDISIEPGALRALAAAALEPGVGLAAPRVVDLGGTLQRSAHRRDPGLLVTMQELSPAFAAVMARLDREWHATLIRSSDHDDARDVAHVLGAVMAIRTAAFREVGGFDERFFLYREETDLCARLRKAGWRVRHAPSVTAVHVGGASTADPWPVAARATALESHYRFITYRWGVGRARAAWILGLLSSLTWVVTGPDRAAGRHALRWHLTECRRVVSGFARERAGVGAPACG